MELTKLVVSVDRTQLDKLADDVGKLQGTPIKLTVEASGAEALKKSAASIKEIKSAAAEISQNPIKVNVDTATLNAQKMSFEDATRAVKDYYAALTQLSTTKNDVRLTANGYASESGNWDALASKLNRATTAFNQLTSAENVNNLSEQQQIKLKQQIASASEALGIKVEKAANAEAAASEKAALAQAKLAEKQEKAAAAAKNQSFAQSKVNQDLSEASGLTKLLGNTLDVIVAKVLAWQVLNAGIASIIRSGREAIETLKEVDSALVDIRKTTNLTDSQIRSLTNETYEMASAYGRTADELLKSGANFARAGFGDQIQTMMELSALLQNVGDLSDDQASKFLIAANAAWKLEDLTEAWKCIRPGQEI